MNILEENRAGFLSKMIQDKPEKYTSPSLKSRTPVPKKGPKEKLKHSKNFKKSFTPKSVTPNLRNNTNAMRESYSHYFNRAKIKDSAEFFSGTKEIQRPHSAISKSFINHLELVQKVKNINKGPNNKNIDQIIKKSLLKAKSNKISKEKDERQSLIHRKIRKKEIKYQNNQIRFQNFQKTRAKSKSQPKKHQKSPFYSFPKNSKSESVSCPKDYLNKLQEFYLRERGRNFNSDVKDYLIRKNSGSIEDLSAIQVNGQGDENEILNNFSFVQTENLKKKDVAIEEEQLSKSLDLSVHKYEDANSNEIKKQHQGLIIQTQGSVKITKLTALLSVQSSHLKIDPCPKPSLQSALQSQVSVESTDQVLSLVPQPGTAYLSKNFIEHCRGLKIEPDLNEKNNLIEQVSEELSGNLAGLFLIEQLKLFELSALHGFSKIIPEDKFKVLGFRIEKKFSSVLSLMQPDLEARAAKYSSKLSKTQNSEFLKKTQKKKQGFHQLLALLSDEFFNKLEELSDSSSLSDDRGRGISHSRSVVKLHSDSLSQSEGLNENNPGSNEDLPNPPVQSLKLHVKPVENESKNSMNLECTLKYAKKVINTMNKEKVLQAIELPLIRNPLSELDKIQDLQIGTFTDTEIQKFELLFNYNEALSLDLNPHTNTYKDNKTLKIEQVYKGLILETINYLLQQFRPFSYSGKPLPWTESKPKSTKTLKNFTKISEKILVDLCEILSCGIGKHEELDASNFTDDNSILEYKERQLDQIIFSELKEEEKKWLCYEFEETQVKIDLADVILYELVTEVLKINGC